MNDKHVPVLLKEVLEELELVNKVGINAIDCTLGQAGHSIELFNKIENGVLFSVDLNEESIQWTAKTYGFEIAKLEKNLESKKWILIQDDFSNIDSIAKENQIEKFDFILADLGYSNFELTQDLGISFKEGSQKLDMRYGEKVESRESKVDSSASDILNNYSAQELAMILGKYGDVQDSKNVARVLVNARENKLFERVSDLTYALRKFPDSFKTKVFQALRSFVNKEEERLETLTKKIKELLSDSGTAVIITFNHREEEIIKTNLNDLSVKEPNITEIIQNPQSRSAKLYIYKTKRISSKTEEKSA